MTKIAALVTAFLFLAPSFAADEPSPEPTPAPAQTAPSFSPEQEQVKSFFEELFAASQKVNSPPTAQNPARKTIENALDWDKVSEGALGKTWGKESRSNRETFKGLLRDVVCMTAWGRLENFWKNLTYKFSKIDLNNPTEGVVTVKFTSNDELFVLNYYLHQKDNKWKIYDISVEDMRYSHQIKEQIDYFLQEKKGDKKGDDKAFAALLDKLRKRRDELAADTSGGGQPEKVRRAKKKSPA